MAATEPLTGLQYPVTGDAATWATYYKNLYYGLGGVGVPRFATTAARDTAYTNWVAAGYALNDGAMCYCQDEDMVRVRESGTWRFFKYAGAVSAANTPQIHVKNTAFSVVNNTTGIVFKTLTVDRSHPSATVNTATGQVTFNERGVWSITGGFFSDYSAAGTSQVFMSVTGEPYNVENTQWRNTGAPIAGTLRQALHGTWYVEAGSVWQAQIFQTNPDNANVGYDGRFVFALIG